MPVEPEFAQLPAAANIAIGGVDIGHPAQNVAIVDQLAPRLDMELLFLMIVIAILFQRDMGRADGLEAASSGIGDGAVYMLVVCFGLFFLKFGRVLIARNGNANGGNGAL